MFKKSKSLRNCVLQFCSAPVLIMILLFGCSGNLEARSKKGSTLVIVMNDRKTCQGELLAVKGHDLIIYDKSRDQGFTVNIEQVSKIWIKKKARFLSGLALGLATGVGLGAIWYACTTERDGDFREFALILPSFATIPLGGLLGALHGLSEKLSIKGEEPAYIEECLLYLQKHARY